jgi:hypothetical protein
MAKNRVKFEGVLSNETRKILNDNLRDVSKCTTEFDVDSGTTGTTLANVVGMVTDVLQPGTYSVKIHLDCLSTANSGLKAAFLFGTASMLTSLALVSKAFTASGVGVARAVTATDAASIQASTAAIIACVIEGTIVVAKAGTLQLQAAQNASHADNTTIYTSSFMEFTPIGATVPLATATGL